MGIEALIREKSTLSRVAPFGTFCMVTQTPSGSNGDKHKQDRITRNFASSSDPKMSIRLKAEIQING
jgi:hypothetical protein